MYLELANFLTGEECSEMISLAERGNFVDGLASTTGLTRDIKFNEQLNPTADQSAAIRMLIKQAFDRNPEAQAFTQAAEVLAPLLSRYTDGMYYKPHLDAPFGDLDGRVFRSDLSMTIFLKEPATYEGGALILQTEYGDIESKPAAGTAVIYSTLLWHEVEPVVRGTRLAIVSWFQSRVKIPAYRDSLYELTMTWREVSAAAPQSEATKRLYRLMLNLSRLWS